MDDSNLLYIKENGWAKISNEENDKIQLFCEQYKQFLNTSKTEREVVVNVKIIAEQYGFKNIDNVKTLRQGDKIYYVNKEKSIFLAIIGSDDITHGLNIIASHADSPRLDLKPNPLYQKEGFAYLHSHYYGGIKKYQWSSIPLAIHGVIVKPNNEKIFLNIGENDNDPLFTISDLPPHLAKKQMEGKSNDIIKGENLNPIIGNIPLGNDPKNDIKLNVLRILNATYNFQESDFISSEIEIVPAFKCRDLGFDRSMIVGYGQDDRSSVYSSLQALININPPKRTLICVITDKEEIGSLGNTSVSAEIFDLFISTINTKLKNNKEGLLKQIYSNSIMLCADVDVGMDPIYEDVFEKNNAAYLGKGLSLSKYSGSKGKDMCSDANAEYVAFIRRIFENNNIKYQSGETGKVDMGSGGTFAYVFANKGIEVIDCGIPILSMHSPCEVSNKYDIYTSYRAFKAFYESY